MGSVPAATIKARPPMGPMPGRPFLPAPTRAGIGYQASAPPLKLDPAPAPPLKLEPPVVPKQRHEVMAGQPEEDRRSRASRNSHALSLYLFPLINIAILDVF